MLLQLLLSSDDMHEAADEDGYDVDDEQSSVVPVVLLVFVEDVDAVLIVAADGFDKPVKNDEDNDEDQNEC